MITECPNCKSKKVSWDSNFTFEDYGYDGEGTVSFLECLDCGTTIEICVPDKNPYGDDNRE